VASATLTDAIRNKPVSGQTLKFFYQSQSGTALTNASGSASYTLNVGTASGVFNYRVEFTTTAAYVGSETTANTVSVSPRPTAMATVDITTVTKEDFTARATLSDSLVDGHQAAMTGKRVDFYYDITGTTVTARTNGSGVATVTLNSTLSSGTYHYTATFNLEDQTTYVASSYTAVVAVTPRASAVAGISVPKVYADDNFYATATITDPEDSSKVTDVSLLFRYNFDNSTALRPVDTEGSASTMFNAGNQGGSLQSYNASFAGNATYAPSAHNGVNVSVSKRE